ncbi:uncharacterized protein M437DRAFT_40923 [Aureobasidium melanogenum CBS 110374]|uniref:Zn(2)-C6 fungal-type domain-containing protein n=1 Tax=Aureobasidium melanogenum (strain CBS 110374) TaxID=1043003 RepID=A0A074VYG5_AURM1|nr:uncharacterized protein M437DRAFT_40923 [Aureobasidium melanogenum CBS 110374]KEQ65860.1 hypothetical protein M437DRAFT_40923 [Aureobasidium melanogenum CBS 110374]
MEIKAKRQRNVGAKYSKNACRTCRIRKVKCDESKPDCWNCVSTGRSCDDYEQEKESKSRVHRAAPRFLLPASSELLPLAIARPLSTLSFDTISEDRVSFQFFTQHIASGLRLISPSHGWITLSLQLSSTEPCIYLAIAACASVASARLSKRHHCFFAPPLPIREKRNLRQYCKATAALQKYIKLVACGKGYLEPILLCCLLLVAYETFQDECSLAVQHLQFGRRAIREGAAGHWQFSSKEVAKDITAAFDWYAAQVCEVQGEQMTQKEERCDFITRSLVDPCMFVSIDSAKQALDSLASAASTWRSELLAFAAQHVAKLNLESQRPAVLDCIVHCVSRSLPLPLRHDLVQRQIQLIQAHRVWLQELASMQKDRDCTNRRALLHMQIQLFYSHFILATARDMHVKQIDRFNDQAAVILDLVEEYLLPCRAKIGPKPSSASGAGHNPYSPFPQTQEYSFSLEYVVVPTLFAICLKIRHSEVRTRALQLLRSANRREAGQSSGELCHYADAIIRLEESMKTISATNSVNPLEVVIEEAGHLKVSLICGRYRTESDGLLEIVEYEGAGLPPLRLQKVKEGVFPFGVKPKEFVDKIVSCPFSEMVEQQQLSGVECLS